jgi:hypothetical protein
MSKPEMSPVQVFNYILKVWLVLCILTLGSCSAGFYLDQPYTEKVSTEVTLVAAYSSMQKCGKHDSCEEFTGRFKTADGKTYDRSMDGFFYHRYVDEGKKPMPGAWITLSANDRGIETPGWIKFLMFMGIPFAMIFIAGGFGLLFTETEYEQREWEHKKEREERELKWRV